MSRTVSRGLGLRCIARPTLAARHVERLRDESERGSVLKHEGYQPVNFSLPSVLLPTAAITQG